MAEKAQKSLLKEISIVELVAYESAAATVCKILGDSLREYDGSIRLDKTEEYKNFESFNKSHHMILDEMKERLKAL